MSKILKNTTGSAVPITDTGITVAASGQYTISATDYLLFAASDDVIVEIGSGVIVVNDGSFDLGISDGTDLIKGIFPTTVAVSAIGEDTHNNFYHTVASGESSSHTVWTKYGRIPDLDSGIVSDITTFGDMTFPTTASTLSVVSDSVNDTSAGTGAKVIMVHGLDSNWDYIEEHLTMNGTTSVSSTQSFLRINRMHVMACGSSESNIGKITLSLSGNTCAQILPKKGSSEQCIFSVPANTVGYLMNFRASASNSTGSGQKQAFIEFWIKTYGTGWIQSSSEGVDSSGGSVSYMPIIPLKIPAKTDIKLTASAAQNNTQITAIFQITLDKV